MQPLRVGLVAWVVCVVFATGLRAQFDLADYGSDPWRRLEKLARSEQVDDGYRVLVRDLAGEAVQADVFVFAKPAQMARFELASAGGDYGALHLARDVTRLRTDADGEVRIERAAALCVLAIGDGTMSGVVDVDATADALRVVHVRPFARVQVEALDANGRPAAALPLWLAVATTRSEIAGGFTDRTGRCELRFERSRLPRDLPVELVAGVVARAPVTLRVPNDAWRGPPQLLQLRLPPTGAVTLDVIDADGARTAGRNHSLTPPTPEGRAVLPSWQFWPSRVDDDGATFPFVALGERLVASATDGSGWRRCEAAGPTTAGETVHLTAAPPPTIEITGVVVDQTERPLADRDLEVWLHDEFMARPARSDADGHFRVMVPSMPRGKPKLVVRLLQPLHARPVGAFVELPHWQPGELALGRLTLVEAPLLASGRLLATTDAPVAGQAIRGRAPERWYDLHAVTDDDGRFRFFDPVPGDGLLYVFVPPEHWQETRQNHITIGAEHNVVRVEPSGTLTVSMQRPLLAQALRARVVHEQGRRRGATCAGGTFRFPQLQTGRHRLEVTLADRVVLRDEVVVEHLQPNAPPRLQDVHWFDEVAVAHLHVVDPDGQPLGGQCYVRGEPDDSPALACDADGRRDVPFLPGQRIAVRNHRFRTEEFAAEAAAIEVRMRPRARLRLHLDPPEGLELPTGLRVRFDDNRGGVPWRGSGETLLSPAGDDHALIRLCLALRDGDVELHQEYVPIRDDDVVTDVTLQVDASVWRRVEELVKEQR